MNEETEKIIGRLCLNTWAGPIRTNVEIIGETPKKYRIRAIVKTQLGGRRRWLDPGEVGLIPKHAVIDNCAVCDGKKGGVPGNENVVNETLICDYCDAERIQN